MKGKQLLSSAIWEGPGREAPRALLHATARTVEDYGRGRPWICVIDAATDSIPGHLNMKDIVDQVCKGIHDAGGESYRHTVSGQCDGLPMGTSGMQCSLPSRESIADSVELTLRGHLYDAVALVGACDKILPGMIMGAARVGIPTIVVPIGPMAGGVYGGRRYDVVSGGFQLHGAVTVGKMAVEEAEAIEMASCPGCGTCAGLFTANSMQCMAEALGLTLPLAATAPAGSAQRYRLARESGRTIANMAHQEYGGEGSTGVRIFLTSKNLFNAVMVDMAIGGSLNTVLHLLAIAREVNDPASELWLEDFDRISRMTPNLCRLSPSGMHLMEDFHRAGGIPAVLWELFRAGLIQDRTTVSGSRLSHAANNANTNGINHEVIRPFDNPYSPEGGIRVLKGNLGRAVIKAAGVAPENMKFRGPAKVFDSEEAAIQALFAGQVVEGDAMVVRYEGPAGGPGMRESLNISAAIAGMGLKDVALISDGRASGGSKGLSVVHVEPEAARGGYIAVIQNGDIITVDVNERTFGVEVSDRVLCERKRELPPFQPKITNGALGRYAKLVSSASEGCVLL